jgi:phosphoribosyl 1,2-cyclic phosphodiesterase
LLVDAGISAKRIKDGLNGIDVKPEELSGILITHEHIDHVKGIGVMSRKYGIPLYTTRECFAEIKNISSLGQVDEDLFHEIRPDEQFNINDITVDPSSIWHDAANPCCFSLYNKDTKISIATDMGGYDQYIVNKLSGSDMLVIEANHDVKMLEAGPYPYYLKRRILGNKGHLSNEVSGQLIKRLLNNHVKTILLGHLSKENNFEELAYETVKLELKDNGYSEDVRDFGLEVAGRDMPGTVKEV